MDKCPIEINEHVRKGEICCDEARQCCFYCFEDGCPIKEVYEKEIKKYVASR